MGITASAVGRLTKVERRLVRHVARGERLDLVGEAPVSEAEMRSWGDSRTIRAKVVRAILCGRLASQPDPHGVQLRGAVIRGRLDLADLTTTIRVEIEDSLLSEGVVARDATLSTLALTRCVVDPPLDRGMPSLDADRLTANLLKLSGTRITSDHEGGAVILSGARIVGYLDCAGAEIYNRSGPALEADRLRVSQTAMLCGGFVAKGAGDAGAVRLLGANITGQLNCANAQIHNCTGPALQADELQVGSARFGPGFEATSNSNAATVRLCLAQINGQLGCDGTMIHNRSGPALWCDRMQVSGDVFFNGLHAVGAGSKAVVQLRGVRVDGVFRFDLTAGSDRAWRVTNTTDNQARIDVDGLTYLRPHVGIDGERWRRLLRDGTPSYASQPYQQWAAVHRAAGLDVEAREALMALRRDQIYRGMVKDWREREWARFTGWTLGYGYRPSRALTVVIGAVVVSVVLTLMVGPLGGLANPRSPAGPPSQCSLVELLGAGLDLNLPFLHPATTKPCQPTQSGWGAVLTVADWVLGLTAGIFATLFVAGFTRVVRRS